MSLKATSAFEPRKRARLETLAPSCSDRHYHIVNTSDAVSLKQVLARVDELERKCAHLETKCHSLEDELQRRHHSPALPSTGAIVASIVSHIDSKLLTMESEINSKLQDLGHSLRWIESLQRNREWKYSAPTIPISYWTSRGFDEDYADCADSFLEDIETVSCAMRRGECADTYVHLGFGDGFDEIDSTYYLQYDERMQSHWQEFVQALNQYHWFLNRSSTRQDESTLVVTDIEIPSELCYLLEKTLPLNHFRRLTFQNNHFGRFGISMTIKCIEKNPKLVEFTLAENEIETLEDAEKLCQAVNAHPVLEIFSLKTSCRAFFNDIIHGIMHDNCKLECIDLPNNGIKTNGSTAIADFLAKNPPLRELTLENNHLNDADAEAIAEALKTNTNLKTLILRENDITERGQSEYLRKKHKIPLSSTSIT